MTGPRIPLVTKMLLLATANVVVVAGVFLIVARLQLRQEFESFLMTTARERITTVSRLLTFELEATPREQWNELLERFSKSHGVTFLLYDGGRQRLAGPDLEVPKEVYQRLFGRGFGRGRDDRPPPEPSEGERKEFADALRRGRIPQPPPFLVVAQSGVPYWVGVRAFFRDPQTGEPVRAMLLLASETLFTNPFFFQLQPLLVMALLAILISVACWLPLVRGLTKSIDKMMRATAQIAEGRFDVHVDDERQDELGNLGRSINRMAARLENYVHGQKRFLGDVAHELRSPLGRMQLALAIIARRGRPEQEAYVDDLREEIELMSKLTDELLTFARAEMASAEVRMEAVNVLETVERSAQVEAGDAEVRLEVEPGLFVMANQDYLFRAVGNLVRNAARYAASEGPIVITAAGSQDEVAIVVSDSGPGIPEEALEKIFTPFYRLEDARDRRTGGTGLGLAIVRSCIEACGGTVEARNRKPAGLEVTMRLKAAAGKTAVLAGVTTQHPG